MTAADESYLRETGQGTPAGPGDGSRVLSRSPFRPLTRSIVRLADRLRSVAGVRRGVHAGGVYYKELSTVPLAQALSSTGPGFKDYRVTFPVEAANTAVSSPDVKPARPKVRVRCTPRRVLADLMGAVGLTRYRRLESILRPGARVLDVSVAPFVTGYAADWLGRSVGPSGAVVCLIDDRSALEFAARRYAGPNIAFEPSLAGPSSALQGETDGGFDAAIWLDVPAEQPEKHLDELLRVVRPGGWLVVGTQGLTRDGLAKVLSECGIVDQARAAVMPAAPPQTSADQGSEGAVPGDQPPPAFMFITDETEAFQDALIRKPAISAVRR